MVYVDTSILVAAFTPEPRTSDMQSWLGEQPAGELGISDWVLTEFSAALSMKVRRSFLQPRERAEVLALFNEVVEQSREVLPVTSLDLRVAARFADQHTTGFRAGDALHLSVAAHTCARIRALDKGLFAAAHALGVSAELL